MSVLRRLDLNPEVIGILRAITVADKAGIDHQLWFLFQQFGINHLLVISGLHIGMIAGVGYLLGGIVQRLFFTTGFLSGCMPGALALLLAEPLQCSGGLFAPYSAGFVHAKLLCDSRLGGAQKRRIQKSTNGRNGSTRTQPISGNRERVLAFLRCRGGVAVVGQMAAGHGCDTAAVPYAWIHVAGDAAFGRVVLWWWQLWLRCWRTC